MSSKPAKPVRPQDKSKDTSVELVGFRPTFDTEGAQPPSASDAAFLARRRRRRFIYALGAIAFVCAILFIGPSAYRAGKVWRAHGLALEAEQQVKDGKLEVAIETVRAAFMLTPNQPEVLRAMAQVLTAVNVPSAMTYWNWVLENPGATDDDRRAAADFAIKYDLFTPAADIIQTLLAHDPNDSRNLLIAARWCALRGTSTKTIDYATKAALADPSSKPAAMFLALQELNNKYLRQQGIDTIFKLADGDDQFGLAALQRISAEPNLKPEEIDHLIKRLNSHPLAGEPEHITALDLEVKRHPEQRRALIEQAVAHYQETSPEVFTRFARWLNFNGEASLVLRLISRERALSNKDLFSAYVDALGQEKKWDEIKVLLTRATVPLEAPYAELYLSRAARETGDPQGEELHWNSAVAAAAHNPHQSIFLANYAEKLGENKRAEEIYRSLIQQPVMARLAYYGLVRVSNAKDTKTLRDILDQMVFHWPKDASMMDQDIYLNLLLNTRVNEMYQRARDLVQSDPTSVANRTGLALAYLRLHKPADALKVYENTSFEWDKAATPDLIVYAAAIAANGNTKVAHSLLAGVDRSTLCPEAKELIKSIP